MLLRDRRGELPPYTHQSVETQLELLDQAENHIRLCEKKTEEVVKKTPAMELLMTLSGVGYISWLW